MSIEIATWGLVLITSGLVWATLELAKYTKNLANLTERLVVIEEQRESRLKIDKRHADIEKALEIAIKIQLIHPELFCENLSKFGHFPKDEAKLIQNFRPLVEYTLHADCANDTM